MTAFPASQPRLKQYRRIVLLRKALDLTKGQAWVVLVLHEASTSTLNVSTINQRIPKLQYPPHKKGERLTDNVRNWVSYLRKKLGKEGNYNLEYTGYRLSPEFNKQVRKIIAEGEPNAPK